MKKDKNGKKLIAGQKPAKAGAKAEKVAKKPRAKK